MDTSKRLNQFRIQKDPISAYLDQFRLDIDYFTNWPNQSGKILKNIIGTHIKIILVERGNCEIMIQDTKYKLSGGDCLIIPPYTIYNAVTGNEPINSYEIFFNVYPITREQEFLSRMKIEGILVFTHLITGIEWKSFSHCYTSLQSKQDGCYAQLKASLTMLLIKILRRQPLAIMDPQGRVKEQAVVDKLFLYLNEHLDEPVQVGQLCSYLALSQSHLYRCCRNVMNCSTNQLIIRYKLSRAKQLLKDPELSIQQIAAMIGYEPFYFSSQFKRNFLLSPSQYREKLCVCRRDQ